VLRSVSTSLLVLCLVGCVAAPPGPRGPLLGNGVQAGGDFALAISHARGTREDGETQRGTSDHYLSAVTLAPQRLEFRLSPVRFLDFGADTSWLDAGADARIGYWAKPGTPWAGHVALGFRAGELSQFVTTKPTASGWARVEAYPLLYGPNGRLLLSLGTHFGSFYHQIGTGAPDDPSDDPDMPDPIQVIRREVRIESAVGYHFQQHRASFLLALEPYFVADAGPARASACSGCETVDFRQDFGFLLLARVAVLIPFRKEEE
jgi:hypothetical protein